MSNVFSMTTDTIDSVGANFGNLTNQVNPVLNSAKTYDITDEDFDFSQAKTAITTNLQNILEKVQITSDVIKQIVSTHTNIQDSLADKTNTETELDAGDNTIYTSNSSSYEYSSQSSGEYVDTGYKVNSGNVNVANTTSTPVSTVTTRPVTTVSTASPISGNMSLTALIATGIIAFINDENLTDETKEKTKLIIKISKDDSNYEKYLEILYKIAKKYGISVAIVLIPSTAKDKTISVSLVKNGKEEATLTGEITEANIEAMFENAPATVQADYKEENDFVYYRQGDYKQSYGRSGTIASSGCGPTSAAMVLTYLTGETVDPVATSSYSLKHGHRIEGNGTSESLFPSIGKAYGLKVTKQSQTASNIVESLRNGNVIIAHMGPGEFTSGGHYIVLRGIDENGNVLVADPANPARNKYYPPSIFEAQRRGSMYSFSV